MTAMDPLAGLLDGPRARGAFVQRCVLNPPWAIHIRDEAPLSIAVVVRGQTWVVPEQGEPVRLGAGDVMVARGPDPYRVGDDPATPVQIVIHPGQHCTTPDGQSLSDAMSLGLRSWGNDPNGRDAVITGTYQVRGAVSRRLLDALPPLLVMRADEWNSMIGALFAAEALRDDPGQDTVLDRLLDLVLVTVLRDWFARPAGGAPRWYQAQSDPVVGPALRLLHNDPARPWTVASVAAAVGISRASLARRFTDLVGEPPMAFLTGWRLALAADLLREPDATVGAVARQVGYGSAFALSSAFKREHGVSPTDYRARVPVG
jgi:AraC-like DNA-binding protein